MSKIVINTAKYLATRKVSVLLLSLVFITASFATTSASAEIGTSSNVEKIAVIPADGKIPKRVLLPQAWNDNTREKFWFTSQGAEIIPYEWFTWLEQPNSKELFRSVEHMESLRYVPVASSTRNPAGLPIGFVATKAAKGKDVWMGMTCAACHTTQLDYQGTKYLIDGAPTIGNFVLFFERLVSALNNTSSDQAKFTRFAKNVLKQEYNPSNAKALRRDLDKLAIQTAERQEVNKLPAGYRETFTSYGRLDAFGNIQNAGTAFALDDLSNRNSPNAPVSYPFLWGSHQSNVVQWNASAPNTPVIGPLARNVGEVIGVFGKLKIQKAPWYKRILGLKTSYSSTVDLHGLGQLEAMVKTLRSPQWPVENFPAIDSIKAAKGALIFSEKCSNCHQVIARENEGKKYTANRTSVSEIGTDPATAWNAANHQAKTLILEGTRKSVLFGGRFTAETDAINIPVNGAVGVILKHPIKALEAGLKPLETRDKSGAAKTSSDINDEDEAHASIKAHLEQHNKALDEIEDQRTNNQSLSATNKYAGLVYKGRPLNGIWATAPYLHNGSVSSLWELMKKGEERSKTFWVGSREFDPKNVGYVSDKGLNEFKVLKKDGTPMSGNSNLGHEYGTNLLDSEKWAVVEYMKTL